ncbi:hypothetical protein MPC4_150017 [Methylocella tundrae]|uniref:Uncharacterized protein n=1 Tax=Methylocella tundrae TaxID=227605 RepID=A0A8B6M3A7_METTU|nr:hypothetical protein MPC4_150017 [Methylocella tundrae]
MGVDWPVRSDVPHGHFKAARLDDSRGANVRNDPLPFGTVFPYFFRTFGGDGAGARLTH